MIFALILAGGINSIPGYDNKPRQFIKVGGRMIISWGLEAALRCRDIDAIQVVAPTMWQDAIKQSISDISRKIFLEQNSASYSGAYIYKPNIVNSMIQKSFAFSSPGVTKQKSIMNGLRDIATVASDIDIVVVMDAARPNITSKLISECIKRSEDHDGAVPTIPVDDSILISDDGQKINMVVPRKRMYQSQTPVAFNLGKYYRANIAIVNKLVGTDINSAVEPAINYGMDIVMFPGDSKNYKITSVNDLKRFIDSTDRDKAAKGNAVHIYKMNGT